MIIKSQKLRNQKAIKFKNITFQAVDWASSDVFVDRDDDDDSDADSDNGYKKYKKRDKLLQIRVYGLTKSGVSVCCLMCLLSFLQRNDVESWQNFAEM